MEYPTLPPSGIGQASKYNFSPWFIKMRFQDKEPMKDRIWKLADKPLSPLYSEIGNQYESDIYDKLEEKTRQKIDSWFEWGSQKNREKIRDVVREYGSENYDNPTMMTQVRVDGEISAFEVSGDIDLVMIFPRIDGTIQIYVADIKSSWEEKPSQQLQAATYSVLMDSILEKTDIDYDIKSGIIYRETDLDKVVDRDNLPTFHLDSRAGDVKRVLESDGPFVQAFETKFDRLQMSLDRSSPYSEISAVECINNGSLSLIGLSRGEIRKLKRHGINDVYDLAQLYEKIEDAKPYEFEEPDVGENHIKKVEKIKEEASLSVRLPKLVQQAQSILGLLSPSSKYAHDEPWLPWIIGSGDGNLPEDNPPYDADLEIREKSMIRVYIDVQFDNIRDSVASVSGVVDSSLHDGSALEFSSINNSYTRDDSSWQSTGECKMLEEAIDSMYNTIKFLADYAGHGEKSAVHFYFYSQSEYDNLYNSLIRHSDNSEKVESLRQLFDNREEINQKMVSIVEDEVRNRMGEKDIDRSLISIQERLLSGGQDDDFWRIQDSNNDKINLREAFSFRVFDNKTPLSSGKSSCKVLNEYDQNSEPDSYINILPREGSEIPVEYLWASKDIDILDESWTEDNRIVQRYQWVDASNMSKRIHSEHFLSLSRKFAHTLREVERSIVYRNTDVTKKPISIQELGNINEQDDLLPDACMDYLDLEYQSLKEDTFDIYSRPIYKRIIQGESVPLIVTNIIDDKGYMFEAEGRLLFDELGFNNPIEVSKSSKVSSGSRMVATSLIKKNNEYKTATESPKGIASSTKVSVKEYNPDNNSITIRGYRTSYKLDHRYVKKRIPWTVDPSEHQKQYVGPGEKLLLDPSPDNMMAEKSIKSLNNADKNSAYSDIRRFRHQKSNFVTNSKFNSKNCTEYLEKFDNLMDFPPNPKQRDFIKNTKRYSLLQGPPGTGKTSGGITHSILSRAYDMSKRDQSLKCLVSGLSNKSVNEVMMSVDKMLSEIDDNLESHPLENTRLIRLSYDEKPESLKNVEYVNYQSDEGKQIIRQLLLGESVQSTLSSSNESNPHTILFSTPGKIDGMVGNLEEESSATDMYEMSPNLYNLVVVDEASMMPLNQFFMISHFAEDDGQFIIGGDQRQLSPVQTYEWEDERRASIINNLPHLSVLNYFRYLRGDSVDRVYDRSPDSPRCEIPIARLRKTYRCHSVLTDFLRETVYTKDDIDYNSDQSEVISTTRDRGEALNDILGESPITLVVHDERSSQQHNPLEEDITAELVDNIPDRYDTGVVTPHNAQKGKLQVRCPETDVETVERFQGGERDVMFLSATASDPEFLSKEDEFILSENRLNVALSRMKKKLVVIASKSVFELIPKEIETYDDARIWKSLYNKSVLSSTYSSDDISSNKNHKIKIYHLNTTKN